MIRVTPSSYYALQNAVWFVASDPSGAWSAATSVPAVIYTIPPSSPVHYVTYVRIYGSTTDVVYAGYTPGYMGTVVAPGGVVVYGTGYVYPAWVGSVWYPVPITYGIGRRSPTRPGAAGTSDSASGIRCIRRTGDPTRTARGSARMFTGLAVGAAIGASAWGWGWHGGYNVTVNNVYNHWGSGTVQARGNTYNYARVGNTTVSRSGSNVYAEHDGNVYRNENGQWQKNESGNWNNVNTSQAQQRASQARSSDSFQSLDRDSSARAAGDQSFSQFRSDGSATAPSAAAISAAASAAAASAAATGHSAVLAGFTAAGSAVSAAVSAARLRRPPLRKGVKPCYVCIESRRSPVRSSWRAARHRPRCWRAIRPARAESRRGADSST